ncbi:winged helix-turn-helix transcriptional regulator [Halobaculum halobium]|uniref:Winged helix-turn-helix transcriptional regulator n=1 Tax=Halobaculum halobium TaxID=3032281 RepID=A0ABD5T975_9EURY|nr:helix-turn-helix domain-containing protein [Halobaculum sp. SYNS20]
MTGLSRSSATFVLVLVAVGVVTASVGPVAHARATAADAVVADGAIVPTEAVDGFETVPVGANAGDVRTVATTAERPVADAPPVLVPVVAASRLGDPDSDTLDHETRRGIHETVTATPGIHLAGVADAVGEPISTVRYHSRVLERADVIETEKIRGKKCVFPALDGDRDRTLQAALATDPSRSVLRSVRDHEPTTVSELAEHLDRARSTVCHHLGRLSDDGFVTRDRDGERVATTLTETVRDALRDRR